MLSSQATRTTPEPSSAHSTAVSGAGAPARPARRTSSPWNVSSSSCTIAARTGSSTPSCPAVSAATSSRRRPRRRRWTGAGGGTGASGAWAAPRRGPTASRSAATSAADRAGSTISASRPPPAVCTCTPTTPNSRCTGPRTVSTACTRPSGTSVSFTESTPRRWRRVAGPICHVVVLHATTPASVAAAAATPPNASARTSACVSRPRPATPARNTATSGSAAPRRAPSASTAMPAGWSRRGGPSATSRPRNSGSELIGGPRELGDPLADDAGLVQREGGDAVLARRGVEDDGGEPEQLLERVPRACRRAGRAASGRACG